MNIGVIGKGNVAQSLAASLGKSHHIRFGVRAPADALQGTLADVAQWADVIILTTPWRAEAEVAAAIADHVIGKPVLDATNPVAMSEHGPDVSPDAQPSAAERLQARLTHAHVVKTFNQIGAEYMADIGALKSQPMMLAAGDDLAAKEAALSLIADAGFEAVDAGPLANARHLESLAMLWIWQAIKGPLGRNFGFALSYSQPKGASS